MAYGATQLAFRPATSSVTRIAMVSPYALDIPGGVQDQVLGLAGQLRERGFEVAVIGPASDDGKYGRIIRWRANGSVAPISLDPRGIGAVRTALAGFDVIHIHEPMMPFVSWAALSVGAPRRVVTFHADPSSGVRRLYRRFRPKWMLGSDTSVVAVSPTAASALGWLDQVHIIPNGVRKIRPSGQRNLKRVSFLGRDEPRKGLDVLLAAWPAVLAAHPEAQLIVMGASRATQSGISFLGRVDEATKDVQLSASAIFCAPNLGGESFGITVVEAMSAGCAVVASDLPAFRDVLGDAGIWFPKGDSTALARQVINLLDDPDGTKQLGLRAAQSADSYGWDRVTDAYVQLYQIDSVK